MARPDVALIWPDRLLLVGCGNMAGAMLERWLACGLPPYRVTVLRPSGKPVAPGVEVVTALDEPIIAGTHVLLGCKPQQLPIVAAGLAPFLGHGPKLISILAGVPIVQLRQAFPGAGSILRCMPNMPVRFGQGVCVMHRDERVADASKDRATAVFQQLGLVEWLEDEALFDAATALTGCGPAYLYRFIDALAVAGTEIGLDPAQSARMAVATVAGAGLNAAMADAPPAALADAVASKGGMTRQGLDVLDEGDALKMLMIRTLTAARDRGVELAALAAEKG